LPGSLRAEVFYFKPVWVRVTIERINSPCLPKPWQAAAIAAAFFALAADFYGCAYITIRHGNSTDFGRRFEGRAACMP
jgi:hypothetical protein